MDIQLRVLESADEMGSIEELQRIVWPGPETEIVPIHMLTAIIHHGGMVIGAYIKERQKPSRLIGFVFGFPGLYSTPDGPRPMHCSHMMGVHPDHRDHGLGFKLKRAQWQLVRNQGLDRIVWTYDPLLSRNAFLNIAKLGAVCNTYLPDFYGSLRDGLNLGLATDRFQVDWWVNTQRVNRRLSRQARKQLDLAHFLAAGAEIINPSRLNATALPLPSEINLDLLSRLSRENDNGGDKNRQNLFMVEIPPDFQALKAQDINLAIEWRAHTREIFTQVFAMGYMVTDFVYLTGAPPRGFYILSHGESTL